ncbi:MAG: hypothetical protein KAR33_03060 [Candidatus Thorarchaeota archaeon]|nr:hypothetical protein [Candidatus Thorarchaeota archaeon]
MVRQKRGLIKSVGVLLLVIIPFVILPLPVFAIEDTFRAGPTIDRAQYRIIEEDQQRIREIEDDTIDIIGDYVSPAIGELPYTSQWEISEVLRNGYGYITINCDKYPLNETAFRRAFAFALDKDRICDYVWDGLAVSQDSCIPQVNPWSSEGLLDYTYYDSDINRGNTILNQAGFLDIDEDSFREAPDGSEFHILLENAHSSTQAIETCEIAFEALQALNINVTLDPPYFGDYLSRLNFHGDYDMIFIGKNIEGFDIEWLAFDYWSEYADEPYWNFPNWQNSTFDGWRGQFLHATSFEDVYEAAIEMQRIWIYECPMVICYENLFLTVHQTSQFTGFVNSAALGFPGWWTNQRVRFQSNNEDVLGGTLRYSISQDVSTWNIMVAHTARDFSVQERTDLLVLNELYDSLFVVAPNGTMLPWLVESYTITTHDENPSIAENVTRFTLEIIDGFTWSDGTPLTAEDIASSLNYYHHASDSPFGEDLTSLRGAYVPTPGTLVVEFNGLSYWNIYDFAYLPILPPMITEETDSSDWDEWDILQFGDDMITSGPFNLTTYGEGEVVVLTRNPDYYYSRNLTIDTTNTVLTETVPTFNLFEYIYDNVTAFVIIIGCSVGIVIVFHLLRKMPD